MNGAARAPLYSHELLALAVELSGFPFDETAPCRAELRSRTCGSAIKLSLREAEGFIVNPGVKSTACAVGQAAAAIFVAAAAGLQRDAIAAASRDIAAWLAGEAAVPDWPRIAMLEPAVPHPGRHEAILLPWRAALAALSNCPAQG